MACICNEIKNGLLRRTRSFINLVLKGTDLMTTIEEFTAVSERIRTALQRTDDKLDVVRELVLALKDQIAKGGPVTEEQLTSLLEVFDEEAAKAEDVATEAEGIE